MNQETSNFNIKNRITSLIPITVLGVHILV